MSHQLLGWSSSRTASLGVRTKFCWKQFAPAAWQCFILMDEGFYCVNWWTVFPPFHFILATGISWWGFFWLRLDPWISLWKCISSPKWWYLHRAGIVVTMVSQVLVCALLGLGMICLLGFPETQKCSFMTSGWSGRCCVEGLWLQVVFTQLYLPRCGYF